MSREVHARFREGIGGKIPGSTRLPLYRQHQRLAHAGITLNRGTLTQWVHRTADFLTPIYHALLSSILQSHVLTMDETPIKAGRQGKGKLHTGYFWPIYGDQDEIAFPFAASRTQAVVREVSGSFCGILLTDGYTVYERYAQTINGLVHAQCWSHCRRQSVEAAASEPTLVAQTLDLIGQLYHHEAQGRERRLSDEALLTFRATHAKPVVEAFFPLVERTLREQVWLPTNPFTQAARYALEREAALRVFLEYPNVPLDTNHLERETRAIAMGRKAWLFCWTEVGARYVGIVQSLLASCRLQGVIRMSIAWMCSSGSILIRPSRSTCSPLASRSSTSPPIRFVLILSDLVHNAAA